jgi:hypothetical protein
MKTKYGAETDILFICRIIKTITQTHKNTVLYFLLLNWWIQSDFVNFFNTKPIQNGKKCATWLSFWSLQLNCRTKNVYQSTNYFYFKQYLPIHMPIYTLLLLNFFHFKQYLPIHMPINTLLLLKHYFKTHNIFINLTVTRNSTIHTQYIVVFQLQKNGYEEPSNCYVISNLPFL